MKRLITASAVRAEHAAGKKSISITRAECIVTPEARTVAESLGVVFVEGSQGESSTGSCCERAAPGQAPMSAVDMEKIRAAVLAQLPKGAVSAEVVEQLVKKIAAEQAGKKAAPVPAAAAYDSEKIAGGIKLISGASVRLGRFDGAGEDKQVGIADVVTADDGSAIAAGFMSWEKCFFPWTLNYDEVDYVISGELHIRCEGQCVVGKPGDVIFIPKGSSIEFGTPSRVHFLYVAYPANWAEC